MPPKRPAPRFGAHLSVAGGYHRAIERAAKLRCDVLQIFLSAPRQWPTLKPDQFSTKNNNQWACKPLEDEQVSLWTSTLAKHALSAPIAHSSYLINLAAPSDELWHKSIDALAVEWRRADCLRLDGLVVHPGAFTTSNEQDGLERIAEGVRRAIEAANPQHCRLLLENTAGQGSCLGHSFGQLGWLLEKINRADLLGVCLDTCHAFAAGYELNQEQGLRAMKRELRSELPEGTIRALHLNDSKKPLGSRVDRHEHIGLGEIGAEGFRLVLRDSLFGKLPGYLETPKGKDAETGEDWDRINLDRLQALLA